MDVYSRSTSGQEGSRKSGFKPFRLHLPRSDQSQPALVESGGRPRMSRCPSLPSLQFPKVASPEPSFRERVHDIERPASATTMRRSVSGMKRLLPLKLTSPPVPSSGTWMPMSDSRQAFESQHSNHEMQLPSSGAVPADKRPRPIPNAEQYRDTPIYNAPGLPGPAHYTDAGNCRSCAPASSCDEACIIEGYSSNEDSEPESAYTDCLDFVSSEEDVSTPASSTVLERPRHSELSFKCLGDTFSNEGTWLRSTSNRWNSPGSECLPQMLADSMPKTIDIEGWISDSTGSSCDDNEDDEDFACATALAPAKAQVVDVSRGVDPANIIIPPRSSSLNRINGDQAFSERWQSRTDVRSERRPMTSHYASPSINDEVDVPEQKECCRTGRSKLPKPEPDLAMASPPLSPKMSPRLTSSDSTSVSRARAIAIRQRSTSFLSFRHKPKRPESSSNTTKIIDALETSIAGFPSSMLLLDAPCISLIREHLQKYSTIPGNPSPALNSLLPTPSERRYHSSPLLNASSPRQVCTYLPTHLSKSPLLPKSRTFPSLSQSNPASHTSTSTLSAPLLSPPFLSSRPSTSQSMTRSVTPSRSTTPCSTPNLQTLRTIFPKTSDFMRSALYAHILAYIYITTLTLTRPSSPNHLHLPFPLYTSSSNQIPSKAASTLGLPTNTKLPTSTGGEETDSFSLLVSDVEEGLISCIRNLVGGMEGRVGWSSGKGDGGRFLDRAFLRALVEVVRGCEMIQPGSF